MKNPFRTRWEKYLKDGRKLDSLTGLSQQDENQYSAFKEIGTCLSTLFALFIEGPILLLIAVFVFPPFGLIAVGVFLIWAEGLAFFPIYREMIWSLRHKNF